MDYVYFFYGFAFLLVGAVCAILWREQRGRLPWGYLSLFGVVHGLYEWVMPAAGVLAPDTVLRAAGVVMAAVSYLFLAEFGRAGVRAVQGKGPGRGVYLPLLVLAVAGAPAGLSGLAATTKYALGFTGGAWAAWALFLEARAHSGLPGRCLAAAGGVVAIYAIMSGLVVSPAAFFPARVFNTAVFKEALGFPVEILRGALAAGVAACVWAYSQATATADSGARRTQLRRTLFPIAYLLVALGSGWAITEFVGRHTVADRLAEGATTAGILSDRLSDAQEKTSRVAAERADAPALAAALRAGSSAEGARALAAAEPCRRQWGERPTAYALLDSAGTVLASCGTEALSKFPPTAASLQRKIFAGARGGFYVHDSTTETWDYLAFAPINDERGHAVGATLAAVNLADVEESFRKRPYSFLVDPHGVVFLSSSEDFCLKGLWPIDERTANRLRAEGQFGAGPFAPLLPGPVADGQFVDLRGERFLATRKPLGDTGWSVVLLSSTATVRAYRLFVIFAVLVFCATGIVLFTVLHFTQETAGRLAASERAVHEANLVLESRVAQRTAELERSNAELEQVATVLAHDLKTPLVSLGGFARLLRQQSEGKLDARAQTCLDHIMSGTLRMERLINGLMAYSRVHLSGKAFSPVDCNTALAAALANLKAEAEACSAIITTDRLPVVAGEETLLVRLFQNLIGNAIKYRGERPPRIHVGVRNAAAAPEVPAGESPGEGWLFTVADNGTGIDPQHFDLIFQIFRRAHGPAADAPSGMGVGLAVCKKIVEWHGGRIWVRSEPGQGATFFFTLP